jgi:amidase
MARTVQDVAYLLQAIAGVDTHDSYREEIPNNGNIPNYVEACKESALNGVRLGVPRNAIEALSDESNRAELDAFESALAIFKMSGATVVDSTNFNDPARWKKKVRRGALKPQTLLPISRLICYN